ncbi:MAG: hypothetical protein ABIB79_00550, partial [archaeon]
CKWKNPGWCNPQGFSGGEVSGGFGGGSMGGMDCWKYDGNQTSCTNSSLINMSCSWMTESYPFCEPDWSANCWSYTEGNCNSSVGCWWNNGYCSNTFDQCWNNMTLTNNATSCNENANCNWSQWNFCEPTCFSATSQASCTGSCRWKNGWCNVPGTVSMFNNMEKGAPVMVGMDNCMSEINDSYLDLCGAGVRDMGNAFGFGAGVADFAEAGICNQEKIGFGTQFGMGNKTIKYFVYLDTDGVTTGGCSLSHNSSATGYEFFLRYSAEWNASTQKVKETFTAKKCGSGIWTVSEIGLSAWKAKMCGEIMGPMIAVEKTDLEKFPTLYSSEEDIRVYVATAGSDTNASSPSDTAGPGWFTPGAVDFNIDNFFEMGADTAMFEDIMKKGFVEYEDCYNGVDDDDDDLVDCADWDCEFMPKCASTGVNVAGYEDTSMPRITGVRIEEYTDAAMVMYSTNKPTNATLIFWHNDSTCSSTVYNRTIDDATSLANVRNYTLWHDANIYNGSGNMDYPLVNGTTYYYKLKVCDSGNKCSVSACSSLKTAVSPTKCAYCSFVTIISPPSGWNVSYDLDTNGTYEHLQGAMCGPQAGMKTNYTTGRKANIKLAKSDGSVYFEFINVTLTKTGLTSDTRTISNTSDLIYDTSENYVGMPADTRDKIINNLHPEVCKIKIPASGTCNALYHCDDSGDNCEDRTAEATLLDAANCIWQLPYCEFSTWDEDGNPAPPSSTSSSSSSSSGGGGGAVVTTNATTTEEEEAVAATGGITGTGELGADATQEEQPMLSPEDAGGKSKTWLWVVIGVFVIAGVVVTVVMKRMKNY